MKYKGKAIDGGQSFIVATNNYRAGGGGHFPSLDGSNIIISAPDENRTVLANDIFEQKVIDPSADNNWSFKKIAGVNVVFQSALNAKAAITKKMPISFVEEADNGFAVFRLHMSE